MEYNGLTFDYFRQCLKEIEDLYTLNDDIAHKLFEYGQRHGDYCEFYYPTNAATVVALLQILLHDKNDWISYWCFERDFGKRIDMGPITGEDGTIYPFETVEQLWDLLAVERRERGEV